MSSVLSHRALGAAPLVATFLALVSIGCASSSTDESAPAALDSESRAAQQPGSSAAVAEGDAAAVDPAHGAPSIEDTIDLFLSHYVQRLGAVEVHRRAIPGGEEITLSSPKLKGPGNEPQLLIHKGGATGDVIVLCHGLSDSPYYMRAIGDRLFAAGANIVLPLLPAHGLIDPDEAMEDGNLDRKWVAAFDHAVDVAEQLGGRISLGGFSTGGTLSVHKALREPERINGGLLLFAAALGVGSVSENLAWSFFAIPQIAKWLDGHYQGRGPNPYKYPAFPQFGGLELIDLIHDINRMMAEGGGPQQPIFAVHSIHDAAAMPRGVGNLLRADGVRGVAIVFAANPPLEHARLTLAEDIALEPAYIREGENPPRPRAFPAFEGMMDLTLRFFEQLPGSVAKRAERTSQQDALEQP